MLTIERDDITSLLKKYIEVFSVLHVPEENWLTTREKEYLIANILLNTQGVDLSSKLANSLLEQKFGFINRGVSMYRLKLKRKGWIVQTAVGIDIVRAFNFKGKRIPRELDFSFKVKLKDGQESREHS